MGESAPFLLGVYAGLSYVGWNIFLLSPLYVLASFLAVPTLDGVLVSLAPCVVFIASYLLKTALKRKMTIFKNTVCALVATLLELGVVSRPIPDFLLTLVLSVAFSYASVVALYAVVVRGVGYRLSEDEKVCLAIVFGALTYGVFSLKVGEFTPYYLLLGIASLYAGYAFSGEGVIFALALGIGGVSSMNVVLAVCAHVSVTVFKRQSRYVALGGVIVTYLLVSALLNEFSVINLIALALGAGIFVAVPKKRMARALALFGTMGEEYASRLLVNRNRADVSLRLKRVADAFFTAEGIAGGDAPEIGEEEAERVLSSELEKRYCEGCPGKRGCHKLLGGGAEDVLKEVVRSALSSGRATVLDLPPYLTGSCARVDRLIDTVNDLVEKYRDKLAVRRHEGAVKSVISSCMTGVGKMMDEIRESLGKPLGFDLRAETRLADNLSYVNVACSESAIYGEGAGTRVCLVVREGDEEKPSLERATSETLGLKMAVSERRTLGTGKSEVWLAPAPRYDVLFGRGTAGREKDGNGDTFSIIRLRDGRVMMAVSDGMGSGRRAESGSSGVIALVESFLEAGFSCEAIVPVVNKLMTLRGTESFQTLDMFIIDTASGNADVIKLGASESFIKRGERVEVIRGSALPIGILDEVKPYSAVINLREDDVVVMCSDGLTDALGEDVVGELVGSLPSVNPQLLADELLERAKKLNFCDDVTVVVARMFRNA